MNFDLIEYAREHRLRVRNLHDGRPLHPLRVPVSGRGRSEGYMSDSDRMNAIIGRHGYVVIEDGKLGWYVFCKTRYGLNKWLPRIEAADGIVKQECDGEMAGDVPVEAIAAVLRVIRPFKKQPPNPGLAGGGARVARRIDANRSGRPKVPPESRKASETTSIGFHPQGKSTQYAMVGMSSRRLDRFAER